MAMVVVRPPAKIVAVVTVPALHISGTAPLGNHAAAVMALDRDSAAAAQVVMDVHAALGVMHVADLAAGAGANRAAALGDVLVAALGRRTTLDCRRVPAAGRTMRSPAPNCAMRSCSSSGAGMGTANFSGSRVGAAGGGSAGSMRTAAGRWSMCGRPASRAAGRWYVGGRPAS